MKDTQLIEKVRNYAIDPELGSKAFTDKEIKDQGLVKDKDYIPIRVQVIAPRHDSGESSLENEWIDKLLANQCLQHEGTQTHKRRVELAKKKYGAKWVEKLDLGPVKLTPTSSRGPSKALVKEAEELHARIVCDTTQALYEQLLAELTFLCLDVNVPAFEDLNEEDVIAIKVARQNSPNLL